MTVAGVSCFGCCEMKRALQAAGPPVAEVFNFGCCKLKDEGSAACTIFVVRVTAIELEKFGHKGKVR